MSFASLRLAWPEKILSSRMGGEKRGKRALRSGNSLQHDDERRAPFNQAAELGAAEARRQICSGYCARIRGTNGRLYRDRRPDAGYSPEIVSGGSRGRNE